MLKCTNLLDSYPFIACVNNINYKITQTISGNTSILNIIHFTYENIGNNNEF